MAPSPERREGFIFGGFGDLLEEEWRIWIVDMPAMESFQVWRISRCDDAVLFAFLCIPDDEYILELLFNLTHPRSSLRPILEDADLLAACRHKLGINRSMIDMKNCRLDYIGSMYDR
jgi:hypothetical protein